MMQPPQEGWCVRCVVERVVDGDTVDVRIEKRLRIRLLGVWAPEMNTPQGQEVARWLKEKVEGKEVVLFIPGEVEIKDILTFGRFVGRIWLDGEDINEAIANYCRHLHPGDDNDAKSPVA